MQAATSLVFRGVPTFFRACCREAALQRNNLDYSHPGYHLMLHVERLRPDDADPEEWANEVNGYYEQLDSDESVSAATVLVWFTEHFPRCLAVIPRRRRRKFVEGVMLCWLERDEGLSLQEAREWIANNLE